LQRIAERSVPPPKICLLGGSAQWLEEWVDRPINPISSLRDCTGVQSRTPESGQLTGLRPLPRHAPGSHSGGPAGDPPGRVGLHPLMSRPPAPRPPPRENAPRAGRTIFETISEGHCHPPARSPDSAELIPGSGSCGSPHTPPCCPRRPLPSPPSPRQGDEKVTGRGCENNPSPRGVLEAHPSETLTTHPS
jgi:hypothetical protein